MQRIKATTKSWEPNDLNNSSTARSDQRKDSQWPRGILSTWELPTHLQYTVPDAIDNSTCCCSLMRCGSYPLRFIAANKPSREMRDTGVTRSASEGHGNYPLGLERSILILQRISLYAKAAITTNSNDVAESYYRNWTRHPLLTAEQLTNICSQRNNISLTQLTLTQLTVESSSPIQNAIVPTNPNDDVLAPTTVNMLSHHRTLATTDLATTAECNHSATTAYVTTAEHYHSAMTQHLLPNRFRAKL
ncbi:hypothetical protein F511_10440 [Dorcoceras hygrometricum]|uniref:Uncharacterized protein n=1 Tax=Dorcoceras hygrometricum TaxID=472368 RepID=A0A2Z7C7I9_9LAMI|nr:hypothetical protein F511_10440 [Dorcoceras hygrometricum]